MDEYYQEPVTAPSAGRSYFPTLVPPLRNRATFRYNLGRNAWALEQLLAFQNVTATIRTNVLLLESGGLWVHSPQWPTGEFCQLLDDIGYPVEHVVLPCNALEHKGPLMAFLKKYPQASVWITPGQYGPFGECGMSLDDCRMGYQVDGIFSLDDNGPLPPWAEEFDICILYVDLPENAGPVSEAVFCHRPTNTLIATDAVIFVPPGPAPEIFETYFDSKTVKDPEFWPKSVLQSVFLKLRYEDGRWPGYEGLANRLSRAPILRAFGDARAPATTREWVRSIGRLQFNRILTSHFASPIAARPSDVVDAFGYLEPGRAVVDKLPPIGCQDWELLNTLNDAIERNKLGAPVVFDVKKDCQAS